MIALLLGQVEILHGAGNVLGGGGFYPAVDRLVVVGTHIGDAVHGVAVGAVLAPVAAVKAEFQNLHAGIAALAQQVVDVLCQKAQILGNNTRFTELFLDGSKQRIAGTGAPAPANSRFAAVGDGVISGKAAEMVNAHDIVDAAHMPDAPHPPCIAVLRHGVPVIQRVTPQLTGGRKSVRRAACYLGRVQVFVQLELLWLVPYIHAVQRNVDGQIPDDLDIFRICVIFQRLPLAEKQILHRLPKGNVLGVLLAGGLYGVRLTAAQGFLPLLPASPAVGVLQCHK